MVNLYTHQQYEPRHNPSNCVRIRGDLSPLVCSLRTIMSKPLTELSTERLNALLENYLGVKADDEKNDCLLPPTKMLLADKLAEIRKILNDRNELQS